MSFKNNFLNDRIVISKSDPRKLKNKTAKTKFRATKRTKVIRMRRKGFNFPKGGNRLSHVGIGVIQTFEGDI